MLDFTERKRHRRLKDLQSKKQSIEEDNNEENGSERETTSRKLGFSGPLPMSPGPSPQCNGLPFSSYLDASGSFEINMGDTSGNELDDHLSASADRPVVPDSPSNGLLTPGPAHTEESDRMPNSSSCQSMAQDVNQNLTQMDRLEAGSGNVPHKRRGSITFVITDHSDQPTSEHCSRLDSEVFDSNNTELKPGDTFPPNRMHSTRKPSVCESIPEENSKLAGNTADTARLSQGSIHGLRLPPPSIRKSGRSMSECSDYQDYSLTSDGKMIPCSDQFFMRRRKIVS